MGFGRNGGAVTAEGARRGVGGQGKGPEGDGASGRWAVGGRGGSGRRMREEGPGVAAREKRS